MREPDFKGASNARAWVVAAPPKETLEANPDWRATVGQWAVYQPGAHPLWAWWILNVVHLRDIDGQSKAPTRRVAKASHEFIAYACDPEVKVDPDDPGTFRYMTPLDLSHQVAGITDDEAMEIGVMAVRRVMSGQASFDSDHRRSWQTIIDNTVRCTLSGKHKNRLS